MASIVFLIMSRVMCMRMQVGLSLEMESDEDAGRLYEISDGKLFATTSLVGRQLGEYRLIRQLHAKPLMKRGTAPSPSLLQRNERFVPAEGYRSKNYTINNVLGVGSYGVAYLAERKRCRKCEDSKRYVALKFIFENRDGKHFFATGEDSQPDVQKELRRMIDECALLQELRKDVKEKSTGAENIVSCFQACCPTCPECKISLKEPQYIVMEMAGEDGLDWLAKNYMDKPAIADALSQVVQGIDYLSHLATPVVHHDLKWENLAIIESRRRVKRKIKIIDFGASMRWKGPSLREHAIVTAEYEPPESVEGYAYQGPPYSYDIYSVGIMAMEALCGARREAALERVKSEAVMRYYMKPIANLSDILASLIPGDDDVNNCLESLTPVIHPDPTKRPEPNTLKFNMNGALVTEQKARKRSNSKRRKS